MTIAFLESTEPDLEPSALLAYSEWLASRDGDVGFDPYYGEAVLRFSLRDTDVLQGPGDVTASPASCGTALGSARAGATLTVCGVGPKEALACAAAIDGSRSAAAARAAAGVPAELWEVFLRGTFGSLTFAPRALADLEARVSHAEIVRFPGSPYEIVRAYWENMAEVRERMTELSAATADTRCFVRFLRELNVVSLLGASRRSFYRPASPVVARGGLAPGALWHTPSVTEATASGVRFVSGPRVSASLIGGDHYQGLLARSLGDEGSLLPARDVDVDGLPFGRIVTARSDTDAESAQWFCPPRPLTEAHFEGIRLAMVEARAAVQGGRPADVIRGAARVHWQLVRLHPFMSGNQSVAMALVNATLVAEFGAGIPHLVLDHIALRLTLPAYERAFARAVNAWLVAGPSPVWRALELAARRQRVFGFLELLRATDGKADALLMLRARANEPSGNGNLANEAGPSDAELALLDRV